MTDPPNKYQHSLKAYFSHKLNHKSYLKVTTDFVNFIARTTLPEDTFLISLDVTSLYTNIPHGRERE